MGLEKRLGVWPLFHYRNAVRRMQGEWNQEKGEWAGGSKFHGGIAFDSGENSCAIPGNGDRHLSLTSGDSVLSQDNESLEWS